MPTPMGGVFQPICSARVLWWVPSKQFVRVSMLLSKASQCLFGETIAVDFDEMDLGK